MKTLVVLISFLLTMSVYADVYHCDADLKENGKGSFTINTESQDKSSIELVGGTEVGCAAVRTQKLITCYLQTVGASTLSAVAELGTSVIALGITTSRGLTKLECHKQQTL